MAKLGKLLKRPEVLLGAVTMGLPGAGLGGYLANTELKAKQAAKDQEAKSQQDIMASEEAKNQALVDANFGQVAKKKALMGSRAGSKNSLYNLAGTTSGLYTV